MCRSSIKTLKKFLENGDVTGVGRQIHIIKGASANVGGELLKEVALKMEKSVKSADLEDAEPLLAEMEASFEQLKNSMEISLYLLV